MLVMLTIIEADRRALSPSHGGQDRVGKGDIPDSTGAMTAR